VFVSKDSSIEFEISQAEFAHRNIEVRGPSININDEKLRAYFLGQLSEAENAIFEEEIALDEGLFEQAQLAERELIDDYLRGDLGESELNAFKANYLRSERRREKVAFAESLWGVANEQQTKVFVPGPNSFKSPWKALTTWKFITGAAVVLFAWGLIAVALYSGRLRIERAASPEGSGGPFFGVEKSDVPQPVNNAVATTGENVIVTPVNENIAKPSPKRPASTGTIPAAIATFTLSPGALRNEGEQSIKIASNATTVDLRLSPANDAPKYPTYSATLKTADGETILSDPLGQSMRLRVPANKLENRTYIILVEGMTAAGTSEPVAEYTFRVRRQK
jgi:hypothetical protein